VSDLTKPVDDLEALPCFAEIDPVTFVVKRVIVADQAFIDSGVVGEPANWIPTSKAPSSLRQTTYAGVGYVYDPIKKDFLAPMPKEKETT
jgi:hypothetical protein